MGFLASLFKERLELKPRHQQILTMISAHWRLLIIAIGCMVVGSLTTPAMAYLVKPAVDKIFVSKDLTMLKILPVVVVIVFTVNGISDYGRSYLMKKVARNIIRTIRILLYNRLMDMPLSFFHANRTGALMSRVTNDVNKISSMVSTAVTNSARDSLKILWLIGLIFFLDWKMATLALFILPVAFFPVFELGRRVRKISKRSQETMANVTAFLQETLANAKIVKAFGMEPFEKKQFSKKTLKLVKLELREIKISSISSPLMEVIGGVAIAAVMYYGGMRVIEDVSTPGTFFSFIAANLMLYEPVKQISKINISLQRGLAATDRIFDIIERPIEIVEAPKAKPLPKGPHRVVFEKVSFRYGGPNSDDVLKDINIQTKAGEVIALVGTSGGGKTTLVNLIPRFFDVSDGSIQIDDFDVRQLKINSLRDQIAIVTQEPILFNETISNNIRYGRQDADQREVEQAAKDAYAYDFIRGFPKGFDTNIGELGNRLSGGERQRICIARALLKDAPILILDEATSALDSESEKWVQKALVNLMKGRTTFMIAHRLSTIMHADRILVVVKGRIVEEGGHEELLARRGEYYKLYQLQFNLEDFA